MLDDVLRHLTKEFQSLEEIRKKTGDPIHDWALWNLLDELYQSGKVVIRVDSWVEPLGRKMHSYYALA